MRRRAVIEQPFEGRERLSKVSPTLSSRAAGTLVRDDDDTAEGYSPSLVTITDEIENRNPNSEFFRRNVGAVGFGEK